MAKHVMNESDELTDRLRELLQHFHPAAAAEFSSDELRAVVEELLSGAATQKWVADQMAETKIRTADFRKEVAMELKPARDMAATLVAAARALLMGGENYSESVYTKPEDADRASYSMDVSISELPERYTLTVQVMAKAKSRFDAAKTCLPDKPDEDAVNQWLIRMRRHGWKSPSGDL